jgi:hypothetical protein
MDIILFFSLIVIVIRYLYYSSMLPFVFLSSLIWLILWIILQSPTLIWLFIWLYMALPVSALPSQNPFPNILFTDFSQAVTTTFGSNITLATVLAISFSLTDNSDLRNLHFRQQHPTESGENKIQIFGWITGLVNALSDKLGKK